MDIIVPFRSLHPIPIPLQYPQGFNNNSVTVRLLIVPYPTYTGEPTITLGNNFVVESDTEKNWLSFVLGVLTLTPGAVVWIASSRSHYDLFINDERYVHGALKIDY